MHTWLSRIMLFVFALQIFVPQNTFAGDTYSIVQRGIAEGKREEYINKVRELEQEFNDWRANTIKYAEFNLDDPEEQEVFKLLEDPQLKRLQYLKILWFDRIFLDGRHAKLWDNYYDETISYVHRGEKLVPSEKSVCKLYNTIKDLHTESSWMDRVEAEIQKQEAQRKFNAAYNEERMGNVGAMRKFQDENLKKSLEKLTTSQAFIKSIENGTITLDDLTEAIDPWRPQDRNQQHIIIAAEILGNTLDQFSGQENEYDDEWTEEEANKALDLFLLKLQLRIAYSLTQTAPLSYKTDTSSIAVGGSLHILLLKIRNFYRNQNRPNPLEDKYYSCGLNNSTGGLRTSSVSSLFYNQVKSFSTAKYDENSREYQQFLTLLDYAVAYEITNNFMGNIEEYVKLLDKPLKRNKYQQRNSPLLEYLFLTWYENIRYNNNQKSPDINDIVKKFSQFTAFEYEGNNYRYQYAIPTRIFALEVIGAMFRDQDKDPIRKQQAQQQQLWQALGFSQTFYNYQLGDSLRQTYASHVAEIYCSLVSENRYRMEDYGLDSSQMQLLANKLAWIYNDFYDFTTPQISMPGSPTRTPGASCAISTKTPVNMLKKQQEMDETILTFMAEAIFWVYGGEVFAFVGRAFRIARGAVISLPRAIKAATMANRGRKGMAFAIEIQKGTRMANLSSNLARNGVTVSATRTATTAAGETAGAANTATTTARLSSNHALRNQYSRWNPRRWLGQEPGQVLEYQVTQQTPGFGVNIGRVSGAKLPNGIRSYQDWRVFRNNLTDAWGKRMTLNTYSFADQQLLHSEALILRSVDKMAQRGEFDLWIPGENGVYTSLRSFSSREAAEPLWTRYMANPTKELFIAPAMPGGPATITSLENIPGVHVALPDLVLGSWKTKVANEIYTGLDWGGTVSNLLMPRYIPKHMSLFEAPGQMLWDSFRSSSFAYGLENTTKFFAGMELLDQAVYPSFNNWITSTVEKEQEKLLAPYSAVFDPQLMEGDEKAAKEILAELEKQGFNTDPVNPMYQDIVAAALPEKSGSTISFPLVSGIHYSSKIPFTFWKSPFESEGQRIAIDMQARRLERDRLMRRYSQALQEKNQRELEQADQTIKSFIQKQLENIAQEKQDLLAFFADLEKFYPGDWSAEKAKSNSVYTSYEAELRQAAQIEDVNKRIKRLNSIDKKYDKQIKDLQRMITKKQDAILLANVAPEGEEAFWASYAASLQEKKGQMVFKLPPDVPEAIRSSFLTEYSAIVDEVIRKVKTLSKQKTPFGTRLQEADQLYQDMHEQLNKLHQKYNISSAAEATFSDNFYSLEEQ